ncbi:CUB and sushi domain-containing protein 3-like [Dreissena polymorpha]|uniref:CUB and sushi domain-containing protein 3-like n=1 Tax=Dreissena polymorpha TaxID=45954 RepID=UPI002264E3C0|nr:CUB and sushi domain-containing protein 3-like [Dreissena polymorpha]
MLWHLLLLTSTTNLLSDKVEDADRISLKQYDVGFVCSASKHDVTLTFTHVNSTQRYVIADCYGVIRECAFREHNTAFLEENYDLAYTHTGVLLIIRNLTHETTGTYTCFETYSLDYKASLDVTAVNEDSPKDINECSPNPCQNGATCAHSINNYTCTCVAGYTGRNCQTEIYECSPSPCLNGGLCSNEINKYTCTCTSGYTGINCRPAVLGDDCNVRPVVCSNILNSQCSGGSCQCLTGYEKTGEATCSMKDCKSLGLVDNGIVEYSGGTLYQAVATFTCNTGYTRNGPSSVTCQSDAAWSGAKPTCTINYCPDMTAPIYGAVVFIPSKDYLCKAVFSCSVGYTLTGISTRTCTATGAWDGSSPTCVIKDCKAITAPSSGAIDQGTGTTYGSTSYFTCITGYTLVGALSTTCTSAGNWDNPTPVCEIKDCDTLSALMNGEVDLAQGTKYGAKASFTCKTGYTLVGQPSPTCTSAGTWSAAAPVCQINDLRRYTCPIPEWICVITTAITAIEVSIGIIIVGYKIQDKVLSPGYKSHRTEHSMGWRLLNSDGDVPTFAMDASEQSENEVDDTIFVKSNRTVRGASISEMCETEQIGHARIAPHEAQIPSEGRRLLNSDSDVPTFAMDVSEQSENEDDDAIFVKSNRTVRGASISEMCETEQIGHDFPSAASHQTLEIERIEQNNGEREDVDTGIPETSSIYQTNDADLSSIEISEQNNDNPTKVQISTICGQNNPANSDVDVNKIYDSTIMPLIDKSVITRGSSLSGQIVHANDFALLRNEDKHYFTILWELLEKMRHVVCFIPPSLAERNDATVNLPDRQTAIIIARNTPHEAQIPSEYGRLSLDISRETYIQLTKVMQKADDLDRLRSSFPAIQQEVASIMQMKPETRMDSRLTTLIEQVRVFRVRQKYMSVHT